MAMSINTGPVSPNHPYFFTAKLFSPRGALAGPMRILFLATKMCQPQCRDEERCAENHSSDHNSALETIRTSSFWPDIRLGVLYVAVVVAVLNSAYKGEKTPLRVWARGRPPGPHAAVEAAQCLAHDSLRCSCSLCRDGGHRDGQPPKSWASESSPVQSYARLSVFQGTPSSSLHLGWSKKTCKETF